LPCSALTVSGRVFEIASFSGRSASVKGGTDLKVHIKQILTCFLDFVLYLTLYLEKISQ